MVKDYEDFQGYIRKRLDYNPKTGILTWTSNIRYSNRMKGQRAGSNDKHYRKIGIKYKGKIQKLLEHRLIWIWMTGEKPPRQIDHVNGNKKDNRWENLRSATHSCNRCNIPVYSSNKLQLKNIHYSIKDGRYNVVVSKNDTKLIGYCQKLDEAKEIAKVFRNFLHKDFANHGE